MILRSASPIGQEAAQKAPPRRSGYAGDQPCAKLNTVVSAPDVAVGANIYPSPFGRFDSISGQPPVFSQHSVRRSARIPRLGRMHRNSPECWCHMTVSSVQARRRNRHFDVRFSIPWNWRNELEGRNDVQQDPDRKPG